mgnify:CR=1 FL=1
MFFAIIHELGHMLAGILLRLKPKLFEIQPFGVGIVFENFEIKEKEYHVEKCSIMLKGHGNDIIGVTNVM